MWIFECNIICIKFNFYDWNMFIHTSGSCKFRMMLMTMVNMMMMLMVKLMVLMASKMKMAWFKWILLIKYLFYYFWKLRNTSCKLFFARVMLVMMMTVMTINVMGGDDDNQMSRQLMQGRARFSQCDCNCHNDGVQWWHGPLLGARCRPGVAHRRGGRRMFFFLKKKGVAASSRVFDLIRRCHPLKTVYDL